MTIKRETFIRNTKKFLFDFIIVTLGILTAFSINKWDENNKQDVEEKLAYQSLKEDLQTDLYVFNYYKQIFIKGNNYLTPILKNNYKSIDSLEYYLKVGFDLQEGNATYTNLKYSGKLEILENDEIKGRLILYYETYYQGLDNLSGINHNFLYDFLKPYLIKNLKFNPNEKDLRNNLKEDEFLNLIKSQNNLLKYNISTIETSEKLVNAIINEINKELKVEE